ncbi:hypothetical protein GJ496_007401 [Pomphorhynchus laevis]|nr:hypothetical protein GJ496_007401 [Pomphorhynchus laevis]
MPDVDVNKASASGITPMLMVSEVGWSDVLEKLIRRGGMVDAAPSGRKAESAKIAGSTPLIGATKYNHPDCVSVLLNNNANPDHQNGSGISALMLAAEQGYRECVKLLVKAGASLELAPRGDIALKMNLCGQTPLFCASKEGHVDIVNFLLEKGANPNAVNHYGVSTLWIPSQKGYIEIVKLLLQYKANPELAPSGSDADERGISGWTPLYVAMKSRNLEVARILLHHGANPNAVTKLGSTPFLLASEVADLEIIKYFVECNAALDFAPSGSEADKLNITGQTPLFMATLKERLDVVQYLISKGVQVNVKNRYGVSPLLLCAEGGNFQMIKTLIEAGADVNICPTGPLAEQYLLAGQTPLFGTAKKGHVQICKYLIENGADVNRATIAGITPLYTAVEENRLNVVECLLSNNADVNMTPFGRIAAELKIEGQTPLIVACMRNNSQMIELLLRHGADPNLANTRGTTPFIAICQQNNLAMAELLIKYGAKYNAETHNLYGAKINGLIVTAESGSFDVLKLLINKGMDPNYRIEGQGETVGRTPLFCACAKGYLDIVKFLISRGANVNATEKSGLSCLHIASTMGHDQIVLYLVKNGADVNQLFTIDGQDVNAWELAFSQERTDICDILKEHGALVLDSSVVMSSEDSHKSTHTENTLVGTSNQLDSIQEVN